MSATPRTPPTSNTGGTIQLQRIGGVAALEQLTGAARECREHACFTASDLARLRLHPRLLGDAVLALDGDEPVALGWSVPGDTDGAETVFAAPLRSAGLAAVREVIYELALRAESRGATTFTCRVPLEAGWLVQALREAGLHLDSQELLGGVAELHLSVRKDR